MAILNHPVIPPNQKTLAGSLTASLVLCAKSRFACEIITAVLRFFVRRRRALIYGFPANQRIRIRPSTFLFSLSAPSVYRPAAASARKSMLVIVAAKLDRYPARQPVLSACPALPAQNQPTATFAATNAAVAISIPVLWFPALVLLACLNSADRPAALCLHTVHDSMDRLGVAASASLSLRPWRCLT